MIKIKILLITLFSFMMIFLSCLVSLTSISKVDAIVGISNGAIKLGSISDYETKYSYPFKSLNIWVKENGIIVSEGGKWKYTNDNIYSAYENFVKTMIDDIDANLTEPERNTMAIYIQAKNVAATYNALKLEVLNLKNSILAQSFWQSGDVIIDEGLIAKLNKINQFVGDIELLTGEQQASILDVYTNLGLCQDKIIVLNKQVSDVNTKIISYYTDGDTTKSIITEGLLARENDFNSLLSEYNALTNEQKNLCIDYAKISNIRDAIDALSNEKQDFLSAVQSLDNKISSLTLNDGILAYQGEVLRLLGKYEAFTAELKNTFITKKQCLDGFKNIIDSQNLVIDSLKERYDELSVYPSDYDGIIAKIDLITTLIADMKSNTLTNEQVFHLKTYKERLQELLVIGQDMKQIVNDYILGLQNSTLYTKRKYKDAEIDKMKDIISDINLLTFEQQRALLSVKSQIQSDILESERLLQYVKDLFTESKNINIWKRSPSYGFGGILDIDKIHLIDMNMLDTIRLLKSNMSIVLTIEQENDLQDLRNNIVQAEVMYGEFLSLSNFYNRYELLDLNIENVLISKIIDSEQLYSDIMNLPSNLRKHLKAQEDNLKTYIDIAGVYELQIQQIKTEKSRIESFGNNILDFGQTIVNFFDYYNGHKQFAEGNFITDEQKSMLSQEYAAFSVFKNKYDSLNNVVSVLNDRFAKLNLSVENRNLISEKSKILSLLSDMRSSELTGQQISLLQSNIDICNEYLSKISMYESQAEEVRSVCEKYIQDSNVIENHDKIYNYIDDVSKMPIQVQEAVKDVISTLQSVYDDGLDKISQVEKIISDVQTYELNGSDCILLCYDDVITAIDWIKNYASSEQKKLLAKQISYLDAVKKYADNQKAQVNSLELEVNAISNSITIDEFLSLAILMNKYDGFTSEQQQFMDAGKKHKLISLYNAIKNQSLADMQLNIQVSINDQVDRDDMILLDSSEIKKENSIFNSYNNVVLERKIGTKLISLYSIKLKLNLVDYIIQTTASIRMKVSDDFDIETTKVVLLSGSGGAVELTYEITDGYLVFNTDATGIFAIVSTEEPFPIVLVISLLAAVVLITFVVYYVLHKLYKARIKLEYDDSSVRVTILWPKKDIKNIALYVNGKLSFIDKRPISVYYVQNVDVGDRVTIFYDFFNYESQFPEYLKHKASLKCTSKKIKL